MTHSKTNRAVSLLLSFVMLLALSSFFCFERAYAETEGLWQYTVSSSGVEITAYLGNDSSISVPSRLANKQVVGITGLYASNSKTRVVSITFPSGLRFIRSNAFNGYSNLERISLPESLNVIEDNAFANCTKLTGVTIPSSVTKIGDYAFFNCTSLQTANMMCGITEIAPHTFDGDKKLSVLTLPMYITAIGERAFADCESLKSIIIPDSVKTIDKGAFAKCTSLASVTLSTELKTLGEAAFSNCTSLTKIFIPNKIKNINEGAFRGCTNLTEAYISPSVSIIKQEVFFECPNIKTVVFGGDYIPIANIFDVGATPTVYYPSKYASKWSSYTDEKKDSYTSTTSISVTGTTKLSAGDTSKLKIVINPTSGSFSNIYSIVSSNKTVATVTADGTVTARSPGSATITVTDVNGTVGTANITVALDAPSNVKAVSKSTSSAGLTWDKMDVAGYNIYRSTSKAGTYKKIDTVIEPSYTDKGLTKGKTYYYKVEAYIKSNGKEIVSGQSAAASVTVCAPAPSTVSATKTKSGVATIKWGKSTGASGYEVYMATSSKGKYTKIATLTSVSTLSYKKTGLTAGKTYYFKVRSYTTVDGKKVYSPYTKVVKVKV